MSGCQFYQNDVWSPLSARGAAIASTGAGLVVGGNSEVHFNSARGYTDAGGIGGSAQGGAVFVDAFGLPPVITDAYLHDNVAISGDSGQSAGAVGYGGAIVITSGAATLDRLRVVHNPAQGGAAGDNFGSGAGIGGGILVYGGSLAHSIIRQNRAAGGDDPQDDTGGMAEGGGGRCRH